MLTTVVFDMGGVLTELHPEEGMRTLGFSEVAIAAFKERIFSGFWESCDSKVYTEEEIRAEYKKRLPEYPREVDRLWDHLPVIAGVRPYAVDWVKELKRRGLKLYVLSNYGNAAFAKNSSVYGFLPFMDGTVFSFELGITKPDRRIYEELFRRYKINPEHAVFIDDRAKNVEGAVQAGMRGILFTDYESAKGTLDGMLSEVYEESENFDVVDENGEPTGEVVSREAAHKDGIRHRTAHIWVLRKNEGKTQILLQKRSMQKDSFPGKYDTSSAGHIQAGDEVLPSALRELSEELGIHASGEQLRYVDKFRILFQKEFHGKLFRDNEISFVFAYTEPVDIEQLALQKEEVESVAWFDLEDTFWSCMRRDSRFCIPMDGLRLIRNWAETAEF